MVNGNLGEDLKREEGVLKFTFQKDGLDSLVGSKSDGWNTGPEIAAVVCCLAEGGGSGMGLNRVLLPASS